MVFDKKNTGNSTELDFITKKQSYRKLPSQQKTFKNKMVRLMAGFGTIKCNKYSKGFYLKCSFLFMNFSNSFTSCYYCRK